MSKQPKIGLALGSGGARGWCHIGVLKALDEIGITPDVVAGTSMGAIVGAAWAGGKLGELEDWVRALTPARFVTMMDLRFRSGGLVEAREIETMLKEIGVPERIEDLGHLFTAIATDMETGREIWLDHGPTYKAVRASAGIPGMMSPIRIDDRWLLDGGLVNPVPVSAARARGAEVIIAVNPNAKPRGRIWHPPEPKPVTNWAASVLPEALHEAFGIDPEARVEAAKPNYFDVLSTAIDVMTETIRRARFAGEPPHVTLNGEFKALTVLELHRGREAIARGEEMVREKADELRAVCLGDWE